MSSAMKYVLRLSLYAMKLDNLDEVMRIMRHATVDVSRRVENLENEEPDQRRSA